MWASLVSNIWLGSEQTTHEEPLGWQPILLLKKKLKINKNKNNLTVFYSLSPIESSMHEKNKDKQNKRTRALTWINMILFR